MVVLQFDVFIKCFIAFNSNSEFKRVLQFKIYEIDYLKGLNYLIYYIQKCWIEIEVQFRKMNNFLNF